jgi:hypothetical protein
VALHYTRGFLDPATLSFKFDKHVIRYREFTYATADEYETNADRFLGEPKDANTEECFRRQRDGTVGARVRYNKVTQEFGVLMNNNVILCYFIPSPVLPPPRGHTKGTNLDYFRHACSEVRG